MPIYEKALELNESHVVAHCGLAIAMLMTANRPRSILVKQALSHVVRVKQLFKLREHRDLVQLIETRCVVGSLILYPKSAYLYCVYALFQELFFGDYSRAEVLYKTARTLESNVTISQVRVV